MIFTLGGHIGSSVSALVDGQLSQEDEDRAWSHVLTCPGCRRRVEAEGRVKTGLAGLGGCGVQHPPDRLVGSLYDVRSWAAADALERRGQARRRVGLVALGAGSVGAAVLGFGALAGAPLGDTPAPPPASQVNGPGSPVTPSPSISRSGTSR